MQSPSYLFSVCLCICVPPIKFWMSESIFMILGVYIVMYLGVCNYRRGMDWWTDLLSTCTHHFELSCSPNSYFTSLHSTELLTNLTAARLVSSFFIISGRTQQKTPPPTILLLLSWRLSIDRLDIVSVGTCLQSRCSETGICLSVYCIAMAVLVSFKVSDQQRVYMPQYYGTWAHLNSLLYKFLDKSLCLYVYFPILLLGNGSVNTLPW
jgi:hypothetical protein